MDIWLRSTILPRFLIVLFAPARDVNNRLQHPTKDDGSTSRCHPSPTYAYIYEPILHQATASSSTRIWLPFCYNVVLVWHNLHPSSISVVHLAVWQIVFKTLHVSLLSNYEGLRSCQKEIACPVFMYRSSSVVCSTCDLISRVVLHRSSSCCISACETIPGLRRS